MNIDYYPFGMLMPGRQFNLGSGYRFGFNGMELDNEVSGSGNSYTTMYRGYDPRLGRWKSLDPATSKLPWNTPYNSMSNNPISRNDPLGDIDKFYDEKGNLVHDDGDGDSYVVNSNDYEEAACQYDGDCESITNALSKSIKAYTSEIDAAKAWAPYGYNETKNDPLHLERGAAIFEAKTFGDASVSHIYVLGSNVIGQISNQTGVKQEVDMGSSVLRFWGTDPTNYLYSVIEAVERPKYAYDEIVPWFKKNTIITEMKPVFKPIWRISGVTHSHPPGDDLLSAGPGGHYNLGVGGDVGMAINFGYNVYLVKTTDSWISMDRIDAIHFKNTNGGTTEKGIREYIYGEGHNKYGDRGDRSRIVEQFIIPF